MDPYTNIVTSYALIFGRCYGGKIVGIPGENYSFFYRWGCDKLYKIQNDLIKPTRKECNEIKLLPPSEKIVEIFQEGDLIAYVGWYRHNDFKIGVYLNSIKREDEHPYHLNGIEVFCEGEIMTWNQNRTLIYKSNRE